MPPSLLTDTPPKKCGIKLILERAKVQTQHKETRKPLENNKTQENRLIVAELAL